MDEGNQEGHDPALGVGFHSLVVQHLHLWVEVNSYNVQNVDRDCPGTTNAPHS